ncbi:hypothetical protein DNTS_012345, partial [Danionella cerebrum]
PKTSALPLPCGVPSFPPSYNPHFFLLPAPFFIHPPLPPKSPASNKVPVVQPSHAVHPLTPLITYSDEHFAPGPHSGHHPQDVNPKQGMPRHHPGPDIPNFYPLSPAGVGQMTPPLGWFSHHMVPGPPGPHATGIPHPAIVNPQHEQRKEQEPKRPHIKKPLNAFMLYMKEMRANVVAECTLKESAAINQILGRRWHALSREEQAKYYELARKERQLHMQLYPGWSARDNYGKKKKRKREKIQEPASAVVCTLLEFLSKGVNLAPIFIERSFKTSPAQRRKADFLFLLQIKDSSYRPSVRDGGLLDSSTFHSSIPPRPLRNSLRVLNPESAPGLQALL